MITSARIREDLQSVDALDWISALRNEQIRKLVDVGSLQLSLLVQQDLAEFIDLIFHGERLVACRNPMLAEERWSKANRTSYCHSRSGSTLWLPPPRARGGH